MTVRVPHRRHHRHERKTVLVDQPGPMSIHLEAEVKPGGDFVISGQDVGEAPDEVFGTSDYEYFLTVRAEHKDEVLIALFETVYKGDPMLFSRFKELLQSRQIPFEHFVA